MKVFIDSTKLHAANFLQEISLLGESASDYCK